MSDTLLLAMSQSGIIGDDFEVTENKRVQNVTTMNLSNVLLQKRNVEFPSIVQTVKTQQSFKAIQGSAYGSVPGRILRLKRPSLSNDLQSAHKKIRVKLNNNEAVNKKPGYNIGYSKAVPMDFDMKEPVLYHIFTSTFNSTAPFNVQIVTSGKTSHDSADDTVRRVKVSDGYHTTDNCLMNQQINVKLLQNPVIKVTSWTFTTYQNLPRFHITEFVTVKNTVDFPLLGNPVTIKTLLPILPKTTSENVEKDGVLIPGSNVNNIVFKILKKIRNHHISHIQTVTAQGESTATATAVPSNSGFLNSIGYQKTNIYSRHQPKIWTRS